MFGGTFSFEEQVKRYTKNLELAKRSGDKFKEGDALEGLAICYSAMAGHVDTARAIFFYNQAIQIFKEINWWEQYYKSYASLGLIYEKIMRDPIKALEVYERAIREGEEVYMEPALHFRDSILRFIIILRSENQK